MTVLVCCPGAASAEPDWRPLAECWEQRLAARAARSNEALGKARVLVCERPVSDDAASRGFDREAPDLLREADRVLELVKEQGIDEPVTVVGHSMGAWVAEAFVRLHPEWAAGLVLLDGSVLLEAPSVRWEVMTGPAPRSGNVTADAPGAARGWRILHRMVRSRWITRWLQRHGAGLAALLVPGRRAVFRRDPQAREVFCHPGFWTRSVRELAVYPGWERQLARLRAEAPLGAGTARSEEEWSEVSGLRSALRIRVIAANGRLPKPGLSRWTRQVLAQARMLSQELSRTAAAEFRLSAVVMPRVGHFPHLDRPAATAVLIAEE